MAMEAGQIQVALLLEAKHLRILEWYFAHRQMLALAEAQRAETRQVEAQRAEDLEAVELQG